MKPQPSRLWIYLALVVAAAFAVRVAAWAYLRTGAIESEGAEYARMAENLRKGLGLVGIVTPGSELLFNPLFPLLIAGTSFVTHDYELAGRIVALVMGILLPLPVFGIASRLFNRRVGFIAAMLVVLHPVLVHLSFTVFSEGPYATLLLSAVYLAVRALDRPTTRAWLWVGGAFGLTYLLRAEASLVFAIVILFSLFSTEGNFAIRGKRVVGAILVFLALAAPEAIFIYRSTGKVLIEGKSTIFFYTGKRMLAADTNPGVDYQSPGGQHEVPSPGPNEESGFRWGEKWALYGIDSHLKGMGFPLRSHAEVIRETRVTLKDSLRLFAKGMRQNAPMLFQRLSSDWFGAPLLPALALLGALRRPWRTSQGRMRLFIVLVAVAPVATTLVAFSNETRYYFILIPLLSIWAANGLFELGLWTKTSAAAAGWRLLARPTLSQWVVPGLIGLAMIISPIKGVRKLYVFSDSALPHHVDKDVGAWIARQQNYPVKVMDISIPLSYHAGGQFSYFPYCDADLALRYLDAAQVDYVVLRRGEKFTQYYDDWLTHGIPDKRAELLQLASVAGGDSFEIFRWHRPDNASTLPSATAKQ
ncbi:MAG TPA: glycosyltransferase family 39 protein [Candidatus Dormibacteraeota bacterium]|nr:glycosyltransferase family 39 protein [Candidatus Dormibacteraeota bacterium]